MTPNRNPRQLVRGTDRIHVDAGEWESHATIFEVMSMRDAEKNPPRVGGWTEGHVDVEVALDTPPEEAVTSRAMVDWGTDDGSWQGSRVAVQEVQWEGEGEYTECFGTPVECTVNPSSEPEKASVPEVADLVRPKALARAVIADACLRCEYRREADEYQRFVDWVDDIDFEEFRRIVDSRVPEDYADVVGCGDRALRDCFHAVRYFSG